MYQHKDFPEFIFSTPIHFFFLVQKTETNMHLIDIS